MISRPSRRNGIHDAASARRFSHSASCARWRSLASGASSSPSSMVRRASSRLTPSVDQGVRRELAPARRCERVKRRRKSREGIGGLSGAARLCQRLGLACQPLLAHVRIDRRTGCRYSASAPSRSSARRCVSARSLVTTSAARGASSASLTARATSCRSRRSSTSDCRWRAGFGIERAAPRRDSASLGFTLPAARAFQRLTARIRKTPIAARGALGLRPNARWPRVDGRARDPCRQDCSARVRAQDRPPVHVRRSFWARSRATLAGRVTSSAAICAASRSPGAEFGSDFDQFFGLTFSRDRVAGAIGTMRVEDRARICPAERATK